MNILLFYFFIFTDIGYGITTTRKIENGEFITYYGGEVHHREPTKIKDDTYLFEVASKPRTWYVRRYW